MKKRAAPLQREDRDRPEIEETRSCGKKEREKRKRKKRRGKDQKGLGPGRKIKKK
jgi:hypothetical protein